MPGKTVIIINLFHFLLLFFVKSNLHQFAPICTNLHQFELYLIFCKRDKERLNALLHCRSLRMKALEGTKAIFDFGSGGDGAYL